MINEKGNPWKNLLNWLTSSSREESLNYTYNRALEEYQKEMSNRRKAYKEERDSIDNLYDTDLLRYIAKTLCDIKHSI